MTLTSLSIELVSVLGSIASLIALAISIRPQDQPVTLGQGVALGIAICLCILFFVFRIRDFVRLKPKAYKTKRGIRDYMYRWISQGERVAIFSRDMSWVDDDDMKELLRQKARRRELILCLPQAIALSDDLSGDGAEVHLYPELDYTPGSRFTIINSGRHDAQVAIGRRVHGVHTIQEASAGTDPLFAVADDLVELISRLNRVR